jgi:16S rRNA (guanine527-N7)-methyltransferase
LGPGPLAPHLANAEAFAAAWPGPPPASALDLGSGGGIPALPLALQWPHSSWTLVEAQGRRARFLARSLHELGLAGRADVWEGRAEDLGREPARRQAQQLVTARGFGRPGVTAECAAPLLVVGGRLLVSEPPEERSWPEDALGALGLTPIGRHGSIMVLEQATPCPERYPRRHPGKRPLF